jgi:excisionase family DNA binding protein
MPATNTRSILSDRAVRVNGEQLGVTDPLTMLAELVAEVAELRERMAALELERDAGARRWLPVRDAATYLGTTDRAVYQRIRRGRIPAGAVRHSGRTVLVDRDALDRALDRSA